MPLQILASIALVLLLRHAREVFIPIVLALLASYALEPIVAWLVRRRIPRAAAAVIVLSCVLGGVGYGTYRLRDGALSLVGELPQVAREMRRSLRTTRQAGPGTIEQVQKAAAELERAAAEATGASAERGLARVVVEEPLFQVGDLVWTGSMGLAVFLAELAMVCFLLLFLLISGHAHTARVVALASRGRAPTRLTERILREIDGRIERFLLATVAASALKAVVVGFALWGLGVRYAAVWGVAAGLLTPIPYVGPAALTAALGVVSYLQFESFRMAALVVGVSTLIAVLEGWIVIPILMGRAARMNQVAVFVGLIFWTWVWGIWGMILAVPMMMVCKTICDHVDDLAPVAALLAEAPRGKG